jgi:hypothetical protein
MTFFVPKGQRFRVTSELEWEDFIDTGGEGPLKVSFDGGAVVITQDKDKILLAAFGPGDWKRAEMVA